VARAVASAGGAVAEARAAGAALGGAHRGEQPHAPRRRRHAHRRHGRVGRDRHGVRHDALVADPEERHAVRPRRRRAQLEAPARRHQPRPHALAARREQRRGDVAARRGGERLHRAAHRQPAGLRRRRRRRRRAAAGATGACALAPPAASMPLTRSPSPIAVVRIASLPAARSPPSARR
jgi:hypothetical protein